MFMYFFLCKLIIAGDVPAIVARFQRFLGISGSRSTSMIFGWLLAPQLMARPFAAFQGIEG